MSDSESDPEELTAFFMKAPQVNTTASRPHKRKETADQGSSSRRGLPPSSPSDVEVIGNKVKGKGKEKGKSVGKALEKGPEEKRLPRSREFIFTSDDESFSDGTGSADKRKKRRDGTSASPLRTTSTQLERSGDALRGMAEASGWKGPARARLATDSKSNTSVGSNATLESDETRRTSESSTGGNKKSPPSNARASTSTTTTKSASSLRPPAPLAGATAPKSRSTANPIQSTSTSIPSEAPLVRPAPPPSFWGTTETVKAAAVPRTEIGAISRELASLSKRRVELEAQNQVGQMLEGEEDIDSSSEGEGVPRKYETVEAKKKREKMESLALLKARRESKNLRDQEGEVTITSTTSAMQKKPPASKPAQKKLVILPDNPFAASKTKGKGKEMWEMCALCNAKFSPTELPIHAEACFEEQQRQLKEPLPTPPLPSRPTTFRPAGIAASTSATKARKEAQHRQLAETLGFTPPGASKSNSTKTNGAKVNSLPAPKSVLASRGKGKEKAPNQHNFGVEEDEEDYFLMDEEDLIADEDEWERYEAFAQQAVGASRGGRGDAIEIDDEDEEEEEDDDVVLLPTARAPGKVNAERRKGPMIGSSPPKGSIFISTMSTAVRTGYEELYKVKLSKGSKAAGGGSGPLAPQKMSTAAPYKKRGGFGGRGRGGWKRGKKK